MRGVDLVRVLAVVLAGCGGNTASNAHKENDPAGGKLGATASGGASSQGGSPSQPSASGGNGARAAAGQGARPSATGATGATGPTGATGGTPGSTGASGATGRGPTGSTGSSGPIFPVPGGTGSVGGLPVFSGPTLPLLPAENCTPIKQSTGAGYCEIAFECTNTQLYSACSDRGDGTWVCGCQSGSGSASYAVAGVTGLSACETTADLCAAGGEPAFSGPEACEEYSRAEATYQCSLQGLCSRPLEGDSSVSLVTASEYVECYQNGDGLSCSCGNGRQFRIQGADGKSACDVVRELCRSEIQFDEPTCNLSRSSASPGQYCEVSAECSESVELEGGVVATQYDYRYASCRSLPGGSTSCMCRSNTTGIEFDYLGDGASSACESTLNACDELDALKLEGPVECTRASQSATRDNCSANFDCTKSGTLGDLKIQAHGHVETSCNPSPDRKSWACFCRSGNTQAGTTFESSGDSWADCTAMADQCREVVDVQFGTSLGG